VTGVAPIKSSPDKENSPRQNVSGELSKELQRLHAGLALELSKQQALHVKEVGNMQKAHAESTAKMLRQFQQKTEKLIGGCGQEGKGSAPVWEEDEETKADASRDTEAAVSKPGNVDAADMDPDMTDEDVRVEMSRLQIMDDEVLSARAEIAEQGRQRNRSFSKKVVDDVHRRMSQRGVNDKSKRLNQSAKIIERHRQQNMRAQGDVRASILLPDSHLRLSWDVVMTFLVMYYALMTPVRIAFSLEDEYGPLELVFSLLFILDIAINFRTAVRFKGVLLTKPIDIARNYFKLWFWIDLVASFPTEALMSSFTTSSASSVASGQYDSARLNKLLRILRIFKLFRIFRLVRVMARLREYTHVNPSVLLLLKTIGLMAAMWHFFACLYWFIQSHEGEDAGEAWRPAQAVREAAFSDQYTHAFYWAIAATTGVGFDIEPGTALEVYFSTSVILLGVMVSVTIIGSVTTTLSQLNSSREKKRKNMERIFSYLRRWDYIRHSNCTVCHTNALYLRSRMVNTKLQSKIRGYFEYIWSHDIELDEPFYLESLPHSLQVRLSWRLQLHYNSPREPASLAAGAGGAGGEQDPDRQGAHP
jgi:hypothetical protein